MALDANEIVNQGWWSTPDDIPPSVQAPDGVDRSAQFYAYYRTYRDGRREIEWYKRGSGDGKNDPIQTTSTDSVPAIKVKWEEDQRKDAADQRAGQGGVKPSNVYVGTNPTTGKPSEVSVWPDGHTTYDDTKVPAAQATQGSTTAVEGTQRADGSWDNEQPREVVRDGTGKVISSKPLEGAALKDWRENRERSRNPGGKTDADARQQQIDQEARDAKNRPTSVSTSTTEPFIVQAGPDGKLITSPNPNYVGEKPQRSTVKGADGRTYVVTLDKDGKATAAPVEGLPAETRPGQVITINGESYWATPNADPGQPPRLTHMDPGTTQPKDNGPQMAPGMSPSDYLQQRRAWLMDQRRAGVSQKDIDDIWSRDVQAATARQNEANTAATQQNQRLSSAMSGVTQAMSTVSDLNKYLPEGSDLGGRALEAYLGIQRGQAQRMGGYGPVGGGQPALPPAPVAQTPDPSSSVAAIPPAPGSAIGPVAAGVTATNAAAINPTGPNVQAATAATMGGTDAAMGALGVGPQAPGAHPGPAFLPPPPVPGSEQAAPVAAIPESPYDFAQRVASTPPWKLSEADHQQAQAMGLGDQFWATPGVAA